MIMRAEWLPGASAGSVQAGDGSPGMLDNRRGVEEPGGHATPVDPRGYLVGGGDPARDPRRGGDQRVTYLRIVRADRSAEHGLVRDDRGGRARLDRADREDSRVERADPPVHGGIERLNDLGGGRDGVERRLRPPAMAAPARDRDDELVAGGRRRARLEPERARWQVGRQVQRERGLGGRAG